MRKWLAVGAAVLAGAPCVLASADEKENAAQGTGRWWGLGFGVFRPNSGEVRDAFEDLFFRIGISPFEDRISEKWKFAIDFNALYANENGNRLLLVPLTFGLARSFGSPDARQIPFVQFGVGPAYMSYEIDRGTQTFEESRIGGNANVQVGVLFDRRFAVTARADWYTISDDFDFSGISVTVAYAAFKW